MVIFFAVINFKVLANHAVSYYKTEKWDSQKIYTNEIAVNKKTDLDLQQKLKLNDFYNFRNPEFISFAKKIK